MTMEEALTTNLTVAKLKALCVLNDLSASGKKEELLLRLLEAGVDRETLGIEVYDGETATFQSTANGEVVEHPEDEVENAVIEEPVMLSLEDEETLTPVLKAAPVSKPTASASATKSKKRKEPVEASIQLAEEADDVLEAELLEAEFIEDDESPKADHEPESKPVNEPATTSTEVKLAPMTLAQMIQRPQTVAVLMALLILGAGGWYYINNQIEPFTADSLRYGDSMGYIISGTSDAYEESTEGTLIATGEYVSLVLDQLDDAPEYCKVRLVFQGEGEAAITEGGSSELFTQTSDDRLGAVAIKGGQGMSWLSVESKNDMSFSTFDIMGHKKTLQKCNDRAEGTFGTAEITLTTWTELRERVTLATQLESTLDNSKVLFDGTAFTYGVGGLLGSLEELSPGLGMVVAPIELEDFFGNAYITQDASGTSSGWEWRVTGSEKVGSTNMWKVTASHRDVREFCLGYANMNLWLDAESPWAARQSIDIAISSSESSQNDCPGWKQEGIDLILPEGELELHHSFERTFLSRGFKSIELGKSYDNRPESNEMDPDDDDLSNWGVDDLHLPDNSTLRSHPLDVAMTCLSEFSGDASGAVTALENDGYVWRAVDTKNGTATEWNISWVAYDSTAGWLRFAVSGDEPDALTCTFLAKGTFDDSITYDRDAIPKVLPLEAIEQRLLNDQRFPSLTGPRALFSSGAYHPDTSIGYLVIVPSTGFGLDLSRFIDAEGATTVDLQRQWEEGNVDHSFSLLVDATDGRLIGWTSLQMEAF
jgi:hypothetical protein